MIADNPEIEPHANQADPALGQTQRSCPKCGLLVSPALSSCPNDGTVFDKPASRQVSYLAGQYEFISEIGAGGMGVIYKARHLGLNRLVAIKMLHVNRMDDQRTRRFQLEAKAVSNLDHPAIVRVYDFGVSETGQPHLVLDFIDGQNLEQMIKTDGSLSIPEATAIFTQICDAIEHAHRKGILHRDIKPSNIMLVEGPVGTKLVKIVDFGIAKIIDPSQEQGVSLTQTGEVFGSPLYMSPEQALGRRLDGRSDVYSTGCVLFETLTGSPPFVAANAIDTLMKHCSADVPTLREGSLGKEFSPAFESLIQKTLAKEPDDRYQTMGELKQAIIEASNNGPDSPSTPIRHRGNALVQPRELFVTAVIVVLILSGGGWWLVSYLVQGPVRHESSNDKQGGDERKAQRLPPAGTSADTAKDDLGPTALFMTSDQPGKDMLIHQVKTSPEHEIRGNALTADGDLDALKDLPPESITKAFFENTSINGTGLRNLSHFPLTLLSLNNSHGISAEGMGAVGDLTTLTELRLDDTATTDDTLAHLAYLKNLKTLTLRRTQITVGGLSFLAKGLRNLENLDVTGCPHIGDNELSTFSQFKSLKMLHLKDLHKITDEGLEKLRGCHKLEGLNLSCTNISDRGLKILSTFPHLKGVYLLQCRSITERGLKELQSKLPGTRLISDLNQTSRIKH